METLLSVILMGIIFVSVIKNKSIHSFEFISTLKLTIFGEVK